MWKLHLYIGGKYNISSLSFVDTYIKNYSQKKRKYIEILIVFCMTKQSKRNICKKKVERYDFFIHEI
jgi:hypothetical protein